MPIELIEVSKCRVIAWGAFLIETFQLLGIKNKNVIKNSHVGKETFYRMKRGKIVNVDAYLRMTSFASENIKKQIDLQRLPIKCQNQWKGNLLDILIGKD